jgi:hypothetical protein
MSRLNLTALLLTAVLALPLAGQAAARPTFSDVAGLWDAADVALLAADGVVTGEPGGLFRPAAPVTRAEFAAMLQRAFAVAPPAPVPVGFRDVPATFWGAAAIAAARRSGWMQGVGGGLFLPQAPVTRAQAVVVLARALAIPPAAAAPGFADAAAIPAWAAPYVAGAAGEQLVSGYPDGSFRPQAPLTRADAAHLLALVLARLHTPAAPQGTRLTTYRDHADVVWQSVYGATYYAIDRMAAGGAWQQVGTTTDTVWGDYHADPATAYAYRVRAVSADGFVSRPGAAVREPALTATQAGWTQPWGFSVATDLGLQGALAGGPGTPLGLGGLGVTDLPVLPAAVTTPPQAPTLLLSDSPETVTQPGILYQATASGPVRLYYDHTNATGATAHFAVFLTNPGNGPVTYEVDRWLETTSGGPKAQGETVAAGLLAPLSLIVANGTLAPGQSVALDPGEASIPIPPGAGVQGAYDVTLSGPGQVSFALLNDAEAVAPVRALTSGDLAPAAPGDGAGRGTYAGAARDVAITPSAVQPEALTLADGKADPYLTGTDATTGQRATDYGNYGVTYRITGTPGVTTALVAVPVGGAYYGAAASAGRVFPAPPYALPGDGSTGFLLAVWPAGQAGEVDWVPPAASYLPLILVTIPMP